jgi:cytosine/adenosine deaminase-related metal-dependent hydrolase
MDRPVMCDGALVFAGEKLSSVGDAADLAREHRDARDIDLGNSIVLPGLINAHVHLELSDLPRLGFEWRGPLADWLIEIIKQMPAGDDTQRVQRAVEIGIDQCLRFGVTTVGDISRQAKLTRPLLRQSPLRVVSFGEFQAMAGRRKLLDERFAVATDRTHEGDRLRVGVSPHAPYSVEPNGYARAIQSGLPLATHLAESPDEAEFLADHTGPFRRLWEFLNAWDDNVPRFEGSPIRFARSLGLLDIPAVLAHLNYCDDAELALLASGKSSVVYCPRTHAYFGHPPHRWRDMLAAGVNVALGTDSTASSPDLNLLDDLRLIRRIAPESSSHDLWQLVTTRPARALQMDDALGSLSPGNFADVVCFELRNETDPLEAILRENMVPSQVWIAGRRER